MRISDWSSDVCSSDLRRFQPLYLNISAEKRPDVAADGALLPFPDQSFEAVICSEVLEHVPDPRLVLDEIARVLKPGGCLLLTVPFLFRIHADPHDFGRYTDTFWHANRSEEHTSEPQSLMRISSAVVCLKNKIQKNQ